MGYGIVDASHRLYVGSVAALYVFGNSYIATFNRPGPFFSDEHLRVIADREVNDGRLP